MAVVDMTLEVQIAAHNACSGLMSMNSALLKRLSDASAASAAKEASYLSRIKQLEEELARHTSRIKQLEEELASFSSDD